MTNLDISVYQAAFQDTTNPAVITDGNLVIREVNSAFLNVTGYNRCDVIGQTPDVIFEDQQVFEELIEELTNTGRWEGEFKLRTKNGQNIYGQGSAFAIRNENGDITAFSGSFTDLTERKQYEDTLKILNRVLRHNLKNDANVIQGYITAVRDNLDDDKPQLKEFLAKATNKVDSLLDHSDTARSLQSLISDEEYDNVRPMDIEQIVEKQLRTARVNYPQASLSYESTDEGNVCILADDAIYEVFTAVIENAVEHNDKETPTVTLKINADEDFVTIAVVDNGPGIPEDRQDVIFGREERNQLHHGRGFSLFFVDNVLQKYHGNVWVENNDSKDGTTFYLKLPRTMELPNE